MHRIKSFTKVALQKIGVFRHIKRAKLWTDSRTRDLMHHYTPFIGRGDLCFDIGANMGARTEIFLGLGARVIAAEPQTTCAEFLRSTFTGYPLTVVQKAVGNGPGTATLHFSDQASVLATLSPQWQNEGRFSGTDSWNKEQQVEVTTLDELIKLYGIPRFCKIDVEGFEEHVIDGLSTAIPALSFEFTSEFIENARRIVAKLSQLDDYEYNYSIGEEHSLKLESWVSGKKLFEDLAQGSVLEKDLWGDIYARINIDRKS